MKRAKKRMLPSEYRRRMAQEVIRLSSRDWNWLLDLMGSPFKPNAKLKAALKHCRSLSRET
jgi:uncharacterized protein (DUF1778 family)